MLKEKGKLKINDTIRSAVFKIFVSTKKNHVQFHLIEKVLCCLLVLLKTMFAYITGIGTHADISNIS